MHIEQTINKAQKAFFCKSSYVQLNMDTTTQDDLLAIHFFREAYHYLRLSGMVAGCAAGGSSW